MCAGRPWRATGYSIISAHFVGGSRPREEALVVPILLHADGRRMSAEGHGIKVDENDVAAVARLYPLLRQQIA